MGDGLRRIVFVTGTRADFGKLKPLIRAVDRHGGFEYSIFVTGMHLLYRYGMTVEEIHKAGFTNIFAYMNQIHGDPMEMVLANTISGLSRYLHEYSPDLLVVHGDRVEAMAGAIVGALRNILVGHVEGGELSGTVDDLIRHSVTKLSHLHFVANGEAKNRLLQLGEHPESINIIGSPDIDVMLSDDLPGLGMVQEYYAIPFARYAIVLYHPVTTEAGRIAEHSRNLVNALIASGRNYVVIYPNNDAGSEHIFTEYQRLKGLPHFRIFPSLRFEYFLSLLKHAEFIVGNSSAGIHEAPVFGVPTVNVGTRQQDRFRHASIFHVEENYQQISEAIGKAVEAGIFPSCKHFGSGRSAESFIVELEKDNLWRTPKQKSFQTLVMTKARAE
jgi:UDP-N-acetylglucosamine 2-epimerase (hydrolysing)